MEKSIETIWKEGFLNQDALIAPKLNNLYNKKSTHIVDKFKRMFRINLIAIEDFSMTSFQSGKAQLFISAIQTLKMTKMVDILQDK